MRGRHGAEQPQIGGGPPAYGRDGGQPPQLAAGRGAGDVEGEGEPVGHGLDPEVLLQRLEDAGQGLGDRSGAQQAGAGGGPGGHRGDRPGLEQPQPAVAVEPELHVLRSAEDLLGLLRELYEAGPLPVGEDPLAGRFGAHQAGHAGQLVAHALGAAVDELVGAAAYGADEDAVGTALDGVGAEHHPADGRGQHGLHEDGHPVAPGSVLRWPQGPYSARGVEDDADGDLELLPAADVEHGLEAAGHGGVLGVLVRGGRPHDEGCPVAAEFVPEGSYGVLADRGVGRAVDGYEDEPRQRGEARDGGPCQVGGLRARDGRVPRPLGVERYDSQFRTFETHE